MLRDFLGARSLEPDRGRCVRLHRADPRAFRPATSCSRRSWWRCVAPGSRRRGARDGRRRQAAFRCGGLRHDAGPGAWRCSPDPSEAETRRFAVWEAQLGDGRRSTPTTTSTDDDGRSAIRRSSTCSRPPAASHGYNAYLNRLTGLSATKAWRDYQLAFNLDDEIDADRVVHVQRHTTPRYTVDAFRSPRRGDRHQRRESHTFHAGAYLGDGLHEGAVRSASAVSRLLGGREISVLTSRCVRGGFHPPRRRCGPRCTRIPREVLVESAAGPDRSRRTRRSPPTRCRSGSARARSGGRAARARCSAASCRSRRSVRPGSAQ